MCPWLSGGAEDASADLIVPFAIPTFLEFSLIGTA